MLLCFSVFINNYTSKFLIFFKENLKNIDILEYNYNKNKYFKVNLE